jgi:8-amino-3,8-dideoxy-alpha-D-manno-octulosonate transaminase
LAIQKKNHRQLKNILEQIPEITFRTIPDPEGDSCTFLSWFLPSEELTQALITELKTQGIAAGNFYWYDHNWHYIRKWDHLKNAVTLYPLYDAQKLALQKIKETSFTASDAIMSRCISTSISLAWTEEQVAEKGKKLAAAVKKVLSHEIVKF